MSNETKFIPGLMAKAPHDRAPEYVKAKLSIKRQELLAWLQDQPGDWINADVKVSQNGKWYVALDDWKPNQGERAPPKPAQKATGGSVAGDPNDDIPFAPLGKRNHF